MLFMRQEMQPSSSSLMTQRMLRRRQASQGMGAELVRGESESGESIPAVLPG